MSGLDNNVLLSVDSGSSKASIDSLEETFQADSFFRIENLFKMRQMLHNVVKILMCGRTKDASIKQSNY